MPVLQIIPGATLDIYFMLIVGILPEAGKNKCNTHITMEGMPNSDQLGVEKKSDRVRRDELSHLRGGTSVHHCVRKTNEGQQVCVRAEWGWGWGGACACLPVH